MGYDRSAREGIRISLGERLRALREERGRTQEEVAWAVGIAKGHLSRLEAGVNMPSLPLLFELAAELDATAADLVGFELGEPRLALLDAARRRAFDEAADILAKLKKQRRRPTPSPDSPPDNG